MKQTAKFLVNIVLYASLSVMAVLVAFTISSKIAGDGIPKFADYQLMVVLSGSMSPAFEAGDVIVVSGQKKNTEYH